MLQGLTIVNSNAQKVETEKDTINHQQRILSSDTTELRGLSSVGMVNFFLQKFESEQRDYMRFRIFFVRRAKINKKYSNLSLIAKFALQFGGLFLAGYAECKDDTDIPPWIIAGISAGIPLTLQSFETFFCKWKDKSTSYHESSKRTGSLIRRVEQEIYLLKICPPDDSVRMLDSLNAFMATWDTIISTLPDPVDESDIEDIEDPTLFIKRPPIF
jgi:hypothetical protein